MVFLPKPDLRVECCQTLFLEHLSHFLRICPFRVFPMYTDFLYLHPNCKTIYMSEDKRENQIILNLILQYAVWKKASI